jgi:membrane associated rhomboid family serine protease
LSVASRAPIEALYDRRGATPLFTYGFLALCYAVTLPSIAFPGLYEVFGGIAPRAYPWQLFTAVFEHGWPGFPGLVHLALNTFLILECGVPCERLLGTGRFVALSAGAAFANAGMQLAGEGANGSSLVIWAWGPPLAVAMMDARAHDPGVARRPGYGRLRAVLVVMYVVVTLAMPTIPYVLGWRGNPLWALVLANQYHFVAAMVGVAGALLWRSRIRRFAAAEGEATR